MELSPGFSSFRDLMDMWDVQLAESEIDTRVKELINGRGLIMFFKKNGEIFGSDEDSRVIFAKLKNHKEEEDMPDDWEKDANFSAHNLAKAVKGEPGQHIFGEKDLPEINVIDKEEAEDALIKLAKKLGHDAFPKKAGATMKILDLSRLFNRDRDQAVNMRRTDEE